MPSSDSFGYMYSLSVGTPKELVQLAVPYKKLDFPAIVASPNHAYAGEFTESSVVRSLFPEDDTSRYGDYRTVPSKFFNVFDKQMIAEIDNTKDTTNPAKIKVYNLGKSELALIKENSTVILKAGYSTQLGRNQDRDDLPLIYIGQVIKVSTIDNGKDKITTMICGDGRTVMRNLKISKSWPPNTTYVQIILDLTDICSKNGIPFGKFIGVETSNIQGTDIERYPNINTKLKNGYQVAGILENELKRVCEMVDYRAYTVLGTLYVEPIHLTPSVEVINIQSKNIIGSINPEEDGSAGMSGDLSEKVGIRFKTFLNGNISAQKIARLTNLLNPQFEGDYRITSTKHAINFEGDTFYTEVTATRIK